MINSFTFLVLDIFNGRQWNRDCVDGFSCSGSCSSSRLVWFFWLPRGAICWGY